MTAQASQSTQVVVGVDGSRAAAAALAWAINEARLRNLRLHVIQVRDPQIMVTPGHLTPPADAIAQADSAAAESALRTQVCEAIGPHHEPAVQFELAYGLPVRVLVDRAEGAALLVLGSSRPSSLDASPVGTPSAPLGAVARGCLRAAPCPVVIVNGQRQSHEAA